MDIVFVGVAEVPPILACPDGPGYIGPHCIPTDLPGQHPSHHPCDDHPCGNPSTPGSSSTPSTNPSNGSTSPKPRPSVSDSHVTPGHTTHAPAHQPNDDAPVLALTGVNALTIALIALVVIGTGAFMWWLTRMRGDKR